MEVGRTISSDFDCCTLAGGDCRRLVRRTYRHCQFPYLYYGIAHDAQSELLEAHRATERTVCFQPPCPCADSDYSNRCGKRSLVDKIGSIMIARASIENRAVTG